MYPLASWLWSLKAEKQIQFNSNPWWTSFLFSPITNNFQELASSQMKLFQLVILNKRSNLVLKIQNWDQDFHKKKTIKKLMTIKLVKVVWESWTCHCYLGLNWTLRQPSYVYKISRPTWKCGSRKEGLEGHPECLEASQRAREGSLRVWKPAIGPGSSTWGSGGQPESRGGQSESLKASKRAWRWGGF